MYYNIYSILILSHNQSKILYEIETSSNLTIAVNIIMNIQQEEITLKDVKLSTEMSDMPKIDKGIVKLSIEMSDMPKIDKGIKSVEDEGEASSSSDNHKKEKKNQRKRRHHNNRLSTKDIASKESKALSYSNSMRCRGASLLIGMILASTLHLILWYYKTSAWGMGFNLYNIHDPLSWIFLVFSILFLLQFIYYICFWKKILVKWLNVNYDLKSNFHNNRRNDHPIKNVMKWYSTTLGLNGKYYLYKLYMYEFIENWIQFSNLISIYLCTLPMAWNMIFYLVLILESTYRCKLFYKLIWGTNIKIGISERNFQIILDIFVDNFFLYVPLALCLTYRMHISTMELLQIVLMPSFSLLGKLRSIFRQILYDNVVSSIVKKEQEHAKLINRNRKSIYSTSNHSSTIERLQNKYFLRKAKLVVFGFSFVYVLSLLFLAVAQLASISKLNTCNDILNVDDDDDGNIWKENCKIQIPYCKRLFDPKCNCVYLHVEHKLNLTRLPDNIVNEMDGLRKVVIKNCSLKSFPANMEQLKNIFIFEVIYNQLNDFNIDISKWGSLFILRLHHNNITNYDVNALWTHKSVYAIEIYNNIGFKAPSSDVKINMPSLLGLNLMNNEMPLNINFNTENFPNLKFLILNGNNLLKLPDKSLQETMVFLAMNRCQLKPALPQYISSFKRLRYLDARDNNITSVDHALKELLKINLVESYFAGNPVCEIDQTLDCKPLCSQDCWSRHASKDGYCSEECNTKKCEYDGGECSRGGEL